MPRQDWVLVRISKGRGSWSVVADLILSCLCVGPWDRFNVEFGRDPKLEVFGFLV